MNWKEINQAYPLAFLEWVNRNSGGIEEVMPMKELWLSGDFWLTTKGGNKIYATFSILEYYGLPEYFDALGIHIDTYQVDEAAKVLREFAGLGTKHGYSVAVKSPNVWEGATYVTRREALEAGIIKAFEIREEQLKQKER